MDTNNNTPFPVINHIDDLLPHIANKPEILVRPGPLGSTVVCYQFQDNDTFDSAWAAECRGIVFDRDGKVAARPLHKFFNVGERPGTQPDLASAVRVMDKRDGSMIHTVWLDGQLLLKSKKVFKNAQTDMAWEWLRRPENAWVLDFCHNMASQNDTCIFELTSPSNRIVVGYPDTDMRLLHVRKNDTGEYYSGEALRMIAKGVYDVRLVDEYNGIADIGQTLADMKDAEGFVLQFANGDMVKAKCPWYLNLHRTLSFTRERDIAEAALEERLDDIKSALTTTGVDLTAVNRIESLVKTILLQTQQHITVVLNDDKDLDRKDFAIKHKGHPAFGMLMAAYQGKEPDYKDWFRKHVLKEAFSLEPVGAVVADD
jgi:RNA ligase